MEYNENILDSVDQIANFIAGCVLFIGLNVYDVYSANQHICPLYCDIDHKHNFEVLVDDEARPKRTKGKAILKTSL